VYLTAPQKREAERIWHLWRKHLTVVVISVSLNKKRQKAEPQKYDFSVKLKKKIRKETAPTRMLIQVW